MPTNGQKIEHFLHYPDLQLPYSSADWNSSMLQTKLDTKIPSSQIQKIIHLFFSIELLRVDWMVMVLIWNPHVSGLYAKRTWMKYYFLYVIKRNEGNSIIVPWWVKGDTVWVFQVMLLTLLRLFYPAAAAKSLQLCPTLCDPIDGSPPGSPFPGILQARTLEWVAISFSNAWK